MILDSCFVIDLLNGDRDAVRFAEDNENKIIRTTSITVFEVMNGLKKEIDLFDKLIILGFGKGDAVLASSIWKKLKQNGNMVDPEDCFIASISINNNLPLVTRNVKHFSRIKELQIIKY
jgi:tRNA(fMet)-specific endonuclease VapC